MTGKSARNPISGTFGKFLIVGVLNTIIGAGIMLALYNALKWGYWLSSAVAYVIGSIVSYILNRSFTFKSTESMLKSGPRFVINIAVCYVLAYSIAKPSMYYVLESGLHIDSVKIIENVAMMFGMGLFTIFNYLGQRFYAFKK